MNNISRFKEVRLRDRKYLNSFRDTACEACGADDGTIVAAHIRAGNEGGVGMKPSDDLVFGLCHSCHAEQEASPGAAWWLEKIVKPLARQNYQTWRFG